jgi:hypothetical protein
VKTRESDWQRLADLAQLVDDGGTLAVRLRTTPGIWRPSSVQAVDVDGQPSLTYEKPSERPGHRSRIEDWGWTLVQDIDGLLDRFIRITTPDDALKFADNGGRYLSVAQTRIIRYPDSIY